MFFNEHTVFLSVGKQSHAITICTWMFFKRLCILRQTSYWHGWVLFEWAALFVVSQILLHFSSTKPDFLRICNPGTLDHLSFYVLKVCAITVQLLPCQCQSEFWTGIFFRGCDILMPYSSSVRFFWFFVQWNIPLNSFTLLETVYL